MKLQWKIFLLTFAISILLGGPLLWTVRETVHRILWDEVGRRGLLAADQLANLAAPQFQGGSEKALLPLLQAVQEQTGALYVQAIDTTGRVLSHTNVAEKGKVHTDKDTLEDLKERKPHAHSSLYRGNLIMEVIAPICLRSAPMSSEDFMLSGAAGGRPEEYLGYVEIGLPLARSLDTEHLLFKRIAETMIVAGGAGIFLFFVSIRRLLRPVYWLSMATRRIAHGDYGVSVPIESHDELGSLGNAFNEMSHVLAETTVSKKVLQASQDDLMEAQRLAHIGSYQSTTDLTQIVWSQEVYRIFGRDPKLPLPGPEDLRSMFTSESWAKFLEYRNRAVRSGKGYAIDLEIVLQDGSTRWITLRGEAIRGADGKPAGIRGTVQDITDRKLAQDIIERKERYFRSLIENTSDIITVLDADTVIQYESPSLTKILGYEPDEMLGVSASRFIHPEDQAKVLQTLQKGSQQPGIPQFCEYRFKHKDGSWKILESFGTFIADEGSGVRIVVNSRDATERKTSEQQRALLFTAIEQSRDSIVITNADGTIQYVNHAFEVASGYLRHEAIGKNPRILKSGKHNSEFYASIWSALVARKVWEGILVNKRKDGSLFEEEVCICPVTNDAGAISNYVAVKRDIAERRKMEAIVRQSDKMSAVGQLAAGVAHEINNPLGVILGFAQALVRRLQAGDPLEMPLKSIEKEAVRCKNLVQDLLTFSRASKAEREPIDINRAVEGALSLVMAQARLAHIEVKKELAPDLPHVLGSHNQVQQIIINLSSNAMDAMIRGGVLTLKTEQLQEGPLTWVCLKVIDTGPGIPAEIRSRIFDPFFTTKPVGKGTGLGLSLVHEIIQKHSGIIQLDSRPGRTEFQIKFPVRAMHAAPSPKQVIS